MNQGKLIVLEGIDGSGKSAQYRRLSARFEQEGIAFHSIVFPRYDKDSSALIRMYLSGEFGDNPNDVNAYAASTFFAVDRYASYRTDWGNIYENGGLIFSDRYTTSNAVHQGCKLPESELPQFFDWLYDLEYGKLGLPRPDLVIYLDVDIETSLSRMEHRQQKHHPPAYGASAGGAPCARERSRYPHRGRSRDPAAAAPACRIPDHTASQKTAAAPIPEACSPDGRRWM